jgi:hypothetical protein
MESWHIALLLKPIGLLVLFGCVLVIARVILHFVPEGRVKRFLLYRWKV